MELIYSLYPEERISDQNIAKVQTEDQAKKEKAQSAVNEKENCDARIEEDQKS